MSSLPPPANRILYLSKDCWSPRYDSTFYSMQMPAFEQRASEPPLPLALGGKTHHPAYYYSICVYREQSQTTIWRRYSHFRWLYDQVRDVPMEGEPLSMPPGTCPLHWQTESFAKNRKDELSEFLDSLLQRPGLASHPAVLLFLELQEA
jgi:PX domain